MAIIYLAVLATCALFIIAAHVKPAKTGFYLGSGQYGAIISAISVVAAFTGGGALINTSMLATKYGKYAFYDVYSAVVGLLISAILVSIGFFGKKFSENFFDIKSNQYDKRAVSIHYAQVGFLYSLVIAAQFRAVTTVATNLQISPSIAVLVCAITVAIYAFRGFDAVTRTDVLQIVLMLPMYIILASFACEPQSLSTIDTLPQQTEMPLPLIMALCLPLIFLPISQELHQRGAAVPTNRKIIFSYIIAAAIYSLFGTLVVSTFSNNLSLSFSSIISGNNVFVSVAVTIGLLSAILSTLDTSTNIASHAIQKISLFSRIPPAFSQILLLALGVVIFLYFKTVLSIILFALFLYMAGPALTFIGIYGGIHPRFCAIVGTTFCSLQAFFHFKGGKLIEFNLLHFLPLSDPIQMGLLLLLTQIVVLIVLGIKRKFF